MFNESEAFKNSYILLSSLGNNIYVFNFYISVIIDYKTDAYILLISVYTIGNIGKKKERHSTYFIYSYMMSDIW